MSQTQQTQQTPQTLKIGIDLDNTITHRPDFFAAIVSDSLHTCEATRLQCHAPS